MTATLRVLLFAPAAPWGDELVERLRQGGYALDLQTAESAEQVQQALRGGVWDMVLCAVQGELRSTLVLTRWVRAARIDVPVLIIDADGSEARALEAMRAGAHDYLQREHLGRFLPVVERELKEMAIHREREQGLLALRESENRFRQLTEHIDEAFWLADCVSGRMIYTSPACEHIWDRAPEQMFASPEDFLACVHPEDVSLVEAWLQQYSWNGLNGEYRILRPDGAVRWIRSRAFPIRDELGAVYRSAGLSSDITAARQLDSERKKMSRALEQTADMVMITDAEGRIEYVNAAFEDATGYAKEEVVGRKPSLLSSGLQEPAFYRQLWQALLHGLPFVEVFINRRKDGELYYEEKTITPVRDEDGNITHFVSTGKDITKRLLAQQRLHKVLHYDALTGLANRVLFVDRMNQSLLQAKRLGLSVGVLSVGVELSGLFNDETDRAVEEKFQGVLAKRLREVATEGDTVARLGRDEFALLHKHGSQHHDLELVARRIALEFAAPLQVAGYELFIAPAIGISVFPDDGTDTEDLLRKAAIAMRHAREQGGEFHFYCGDMQGDVCHING